MYVHGGAYIAEITRQHWDLISQLADAGVQVEVPLYGVAPRHTYRDAYSMLTETYRRLVSEFDASRVGIAGDSAGGGLGLGFAQTLDSSGLPAPARMVLIAPWLDLTLGSEDIPAAAAHDPWLTPAGLIEAGIAGPAAMTRLSHGSAPSMAPSPVSPRLTSTSVAVTCSCPTYAAQRARTVGWLVTVIEEPGAVHVYPLVPAPEGWHARSRIINSLTS
jgi:epsilon-lactone hydrolase